jgi:hypothetical protein
MNEQVFRLQPHTHDSDDRFYTGISASGEQALICSVGHQDDTLILVIKFDLDGNYTSYDQIKSTIDYNAFEEGFAKDNPDIPSEWLLTRTYIAFGTARASEERQVRDSLGYKSGAIVVKPFFLEEHDVGIFQYPSSLVDVAESPDSFREDRPDLIERLESWIQKKFFVFHRENDAYVDGNTGLVWET